MPLRWRAARRGDGLGDVVLVVGEGLGDGLWDDDLRGAVHHGVDLLLAEQTVQELIIGDVSLVEGPVSDELTAARGEIIEDHDAVARVLAG